jgi:hypothetical protein
LPSTGELPCPKSQILLTISPVDWSENPTEIGEQPLVGLAVKSAFNWAWAWWYPANRIKNNTIFFKGPNYAKIFKDKLIAFE